LAEKGRVLGGIMIGEKRGVLGAIMIGGKSEGFARDDDWWKEGGIGSNHNWLKK
jgi:hypothetical protein